MKPTYLCLVFLLFIFACSKKNDELTPDYNNISGVWQANDYELNGNPLYADDYYSNNYYLFNQDRTFSARIGDSGNDEYSFGTMEISGRDIILTPNAAINSKTTVIQVTEITSDSLKIMEVDGNDIYKMALHKIKVPTTYHVSNLSSYGILISSFYYDGEFKDICFHGYIENGNDGSDQVYTRRDMIWLAMQYANTHFICAYPKFLFKGGGNIVALYDTTSVYVESSVILHNNGYIKSASVPVSLRSAIQDVLREDK